MFPVSLWRTKIVIGAMLLWAGCKCLKNGGIDWRGTRYPLADLRRGQRVKFIDL